ILLHPRYGAFDLEVVEGSSRAETGLIGIAQVSGSRQVRNTCRADVARILEPLGAEDTDGAARHHEVEGGDTAGEKGSAVREHGCGCGRAADELVQRQGG